VAPLLTAIAVDASSTVHLTLFVERQLAPDAAAGAGDLPGHPHQAFTKVTKEAQNQALIGGFTPSQTA
jgi:hypothetical protein